MTIATMMATMATVEAATITPYLSEACERNLSGQWDGSCPRKRHPRRASTVRSAWRALQLAYR